ncbi:MAG: Xaa-Pro peptidase family protein [Bacteroidota bacterium]
MLQRSPQARRVEEVRHRVVRSRLDAFLVTSLPHIRYLSGFSGSHAAAVLTKDSFWLLTDGRYADQVRDEVLSAKILIAKGSLWGEISQYGLFRHERRIGVEAQHLSVASMGSLKKLFPKKRFALTSGLIEGVATVKDDSEIERIKRAVAITDKVFKKLLTILKPGLAEKEIAAEISYWHRKYGADADAFEPIVASGLRGAFPHARASEKIVRKGELVTLDFGCRFEGYHSDLTRTVAVGAPSRKARGIYTAVLQAQELAIGAAHAGMSGRALDALSRRSLRRGNLAKYFTHSLGHGLGLRVHEIPRLSRLSNDVLVAGNVVTIEPGVYLPGFGGVRIEDDLLIHKDHGEVLNRSPKELIVV